MERPLPLWRFPLLASSSIDEITSALNAAGGGERRCISKPRGQGSYAFNHLRLGPVSLMSQVATETTISHRQDAAGTFYLPLADRLQVSQGRRSLDAGTGQLMCVMPGSDRIMHFGEGLRSIVVRINEVALAQAMRLAGRDAAAGWSSLVDVIDDRGPAAASFTRLLRDTVRMYDDGVSAPDPRVDEIMARNLAREAAAMLSVLLPGQPRVDGPSFAVAAAAEAVMVRRFASPLTSSEIAEEIGQTLPGLKASVLLYTGLLPTELLMLVRLIAADEYLRRSFNDPAGVAKACGFVTEERYRFALARRDRLKGMMTRRARGRGFSPEAGMTGEE